MNIFQLILPLFNLRFFKKIDNTDIKKFNEKTQLKYKNYEVSTLFEQLLEVDEVPYEIISKYWIRAYTYECNFYKVMNKCLRGNKTENYLIFIQMMYEGVKIKSLTYEPVDILFRGTFFKTEELEKLESHHKNKKIIAKDWKFPKSLVYSKSFFSFSYNKTEALKFKKNTLLILRNKKLDHSPNGASIEKYSFYKKEKEVLFFPFTCFEVKEINKISDNDYIIELNLLVEYENLFEKKTPEELIKLVPINSNYVKDIFASQIIDKQYKLVKNMTLIYKIKAEKEENRIRIFGGNFVINNRSKCYLIYNEKEFELKEYFYITDLDEDEEVDEFKIELILTEEINNLKHMFDCCSSLVSANDNCILSECEITDISHLFYNCTSLKDISFFNDWDISNATDMSYVFYNCLSLGSISNISKLNTSKIKNMSYIFYKCSSLESLDISDWDTSNVTNMDFMFYNCSSLNSFPDISNWNFSKLKSAFNIINKNDYNFYIFPSIIKSFLNKNKFK